MSKIVHEWDVHLDIFCRPQAIENLRGNICLSEQILLQKTAIALGDPDYSTEGRISLHSRHPSHILYDYLSELSSADRKSIIGLNKTQVFRVSVLFILIDQRVELDPGGYLG